MPTEKQKLGDFGEKLVAKQCYCFRCKRKGTLKKLPGNFKCADVICDFCGYLAQVKSHKSEKLDKVPSNIRSAAWGVQKVRMDSGIYFPLFLVLVNKRKKYSIFYLPSDLQTTEMFKPDKKPLSSKAKRSGWLGYSYDFKDKGDLFLRVL